MMNSTENSTERNSQEESTKGIVQPLQMNAVSFSLGSTIFIENVIALMFIISCTKMAPQIKLLSMNLTITDLLTGLTMIADSFFPPTISREACRTLHISYATFVAVSFLTITSFAVDRCFALRFAMRYHTFVTAMRLKVFVCCLWVVGHALAYLTYMDGFQNYTLCLQSSSYGRYGLILASIVYNFVLLLNCILYIYLYRVLRIQCKTLAVLDKISKRRMFRLHFRVMKKVCGITLPFICLCSPNVIINSCVIFADLETCNSTVFRYRGLAGIFVLLNSCLNPFLYIWRYTECRYRFIQKCCFWNAEVRRKYEHLQKLYFAEYLNPETFTLSNS